MEQRSKRRAVTVGILFAAAVAVRIVYIIQFSTSPFFDPQVMGVDAAMYDAEAVRLASGDWLGTGVFEMMPGFAYVLGILYAFIGRHIFAAYILQACLGAAVVPFVYLIAERLAGERAALLAAVGAVISQSLVFHTGMLTGDMFAAFMAVAVVYVMIIAVNGERAWPFILAGALAGLGILFRGTFAIFIVLFVPWYVIFYRRLGIGKTIARCVLVVAAVIVVITPVTVRNYVVGKSFVPVTAHGGLSIYLGYNPYARGTFRLVPELGIGREEMRSNAKRIAEAKVGRKLKPSEVSRFWSDRAIQYIRSHPGRSLDLVKEKILVFFNQATDIADITTLGSMKRFSWLLRWCLLPFGVASILGLAGMVIWAVRKNKRGGTGLLYLFILSNLLAVIMTIVNGRYRLTAVPFLLIFTGITIDYIIQSIRRPGRLVAIAILVIICGAVVYLPIVKADPTVFRLKEIGDAYLRAGQMDEAERMFLKAIEEDGSYIQAHYILGALYWKQGRFDEAHEMMEKILEQRPRYVPALNSIGDLLLKKGDLDGAVQYWKKSLDINPNQPKVQAKIKQSK